MKRNKEAGVARRAISLPSAIDEKIASLARAEGRSYSGVVQEALALWVSVRKRRTLEAAYEQYYAKADVRRQSESLADDFSRLAGKNWPS